MQAMYCLALMTLCCMFVCFMLCLRSPGLQFSLIWRLLASTIHDFPSSLGFSLLFTCGVKHGSSLDSCPALSLFIFLHGSRELRCIGGSHA